ncbi:AP endonuclease [Spathaspora passalidarum NRRL Y-27907]|uniref:AP endonuclease n=1 Tax=Spathaspora passalidarum (strain NRRL Y-27907 / 11-Y1) TaxID=619300 RepID=G3AGD2_SPAPN|nr:AP endonuclease [Spathaspora passalidarum NRRL Y-27907]EGW35271.1 AP endonuclease [Spathaspora passalidarum NRRL Y-27907]
MNIKDLQTQDPLNKIHRKKSSQSVRFVTFNVNGAKTLFNYHPWTKFNNDLNSVFTSLQADVITLQELKVSPSNLSTIKDVGHLQNYKSFISLPRVKKGYSGVGVFVRIPQENESNAVKRSLTVVKAEEGITGWLCPRNSKLSYRTMDKEQQIGGYVDDLDSQQGLNLDSEGRCVVIEFTNNLVVFSLYCPANSSGTEEGEEFRLKFMKVLFERCYNLKFKLGKEVLIMGDINISTDLIDHAQTIEDMVLNRLGKNSPNGNNFETINYEQCCDFKKSTPARHLLNEYVIPGLWHDLSLQSSPSDSHRKQFLYDTTRFLQGRRMKMYTVWNTLTNSRAVNFGSRIDLILTSSYHMVKSVSQADIWEFILGSDHCPVFTDFEAGYDDLKQEEEVVLPCVTLPFEAKLHYKLTKNRDISSLFAPRKSKSTDSVEVTPLSDSANSQSSTQAEDSASEQPAKRPKLNYVSRKVDKSQKKGNQKSISSFFS